jgi:lipopolysaccharide/colanic/teichoic acid biosynthesis glycosyltransferase
MATLKLANRNQPDKGSITRRVATGMYPCPPKLISEEAFSQMLRLEQRRTERSGRSFLLVLISGEDLRANPDDEFVGEIASAISSCIRETDVFGWYEKLTTLGLMMTEIADTSAGVVEAIVRKISIVLQKSLSAEVYCRLALVVRIFPSESEDRVFRVDLSNRGMATWIDQGVKRTIDIVASVAALIVLSPLFVLIAILVKCTSEGPILFCRKRVGRHGKEFSFYKFRTMSTNNDPNIHREYVAKLIAGVADAKQNDGLFKLVNDPRITRIGRFLRRSSLDELPQFFNVLLNDMSLVGPRPPLPYEYERYCNWHKRRVLELKPGITGLWQVEGRSRTTFDEMVRMDLRYSKVRSIWLDLKIMLKTPAVMFFGRGAC